MGGCVPNLSVAFAARAAVVAVITAVLITSLTAVLPRAFTPSLLIRQGRDSVNQDGSEILGQQWLNMGQLRQQRWWWGAAVREETYRIVVHGGVGGV